ncbi:conserved unknown protein [Ectocarpus siliculosus]|uniref:EsV-1-166 n=1 Tax=Ectocarpus siliculosus TaxID=2880 RepID=D7FT54_ECTSI|nr:conserved unknown protein [Ectocarpus siliculosus]|eukprot:CBJ49226.1 conserved unknown protein [Ectocarpus siliculosus]
MHTSFLSVCAGPLLLALAANACDDSSAPAPTPEYSGDSSKGTTPSPVSPATSPTDTVVAFADSDDYVEPEPTDDDGEVEDEEGVPLENDGDGEVCSTYDEDVHVAYLLPEMCEWNTYMCCWTGNDGPDGMTSNTDVCRVWDYPEEGNSLEFPRDSEGSVYCHGFGWADGADVNTNILPLYHSVINTGRTEEGGYYGNVEGAPQCGCLEEMPVVSFSECSRFDGDGITDCGEHGLYSNYVSRIDEPNGPLEDNLVRICDNYDVPDFDFRECDSHTYMCCWTENDAKGVLDNTDVCRIHDYPSAGETLEYPGDSEGDVHCHGIVWPEDATDKYIHLLAQYVQTFDHIGNKGYYGNIEGAPMCGCAEDMPEVSKADCTNYSPTEEDEDRIRGCDPNDLRTRYDVLYPDGDLDNLVGRCDNQ